MEDSEHRDLFAYSNPALQSRLSNCLPSSVLRGGRVAPGWAGGSQSRWLLWVSVCFVYAQSRTSRATGQVWSWLTVINHYPSHLKEQPFTPPPSQGSLAVRSIAVEGGGLPVMGTEASPCTDGVYTLACSNPCTCTHTCVHRPTHRHMLTHTMPWLDLRRLLHY